ncbi:toxin C-terminal domain-containing protein [Enterobacter roggenkampii]|uniref:toxin C-terminal domain-containing protein n=1 Tax=Enterobacter roggenkampii TaxID=1812935 RepID=UPI000A0ED639
MREILISESAWEEMTCLFAPSLAYLALKGKEAEEAAKKLGFDTRIPPQKAPFNSHGQPVYSDGKKYITPDIDSHNVTNGWKMFDRKGNRIGTYDSNLNRIKD